MNEEIMKLHCNHCDNDVEVTEDKVTTDIVNGRIDLQIECPECFDLVGYHFIGPDDICPDAQ